MSNRTFSKSKVNGTLLAFLISTLPIITIYGQDHGLYDFSLRATSDDPGIGERLSKSLATTGSVGAGTAIGAVIGGAIGGGVTLPTGPGAVPGALTGAEIGAIVGGIVGDIFVGPTIWNNPFFVPDVKMLSPKQCPPGAALTCYSGDTWPPSPCYTVFFGEAEPVIHDEEACELYNEERCMDPAYYTIERCGIGIPRP